ncbi:hypothetical protein GGF32_004651 [Allomyces javanicus]|nr:hypothetical protein GGF32_004651 [Allomyces javanicus]
MDAIAPADAPLAPTPVVPADPYPRPTPLTVDDLAFLLGSGSTSEPTDPLASPVLVLDLRPRSAYRHGHVRGAINVCLPGTLLRRTAYSMDKVAASLVAESDRLRVANWRTASTIILYDDCAPDRCGIPRPITIPGAPAPCPVPDMARKLASAQGVVHVVGGFAAVASDRPDLIVTAVVTPGGTMATPGGSVVTPGAMSPAIPKRWRAAAMSPGSTGPTPPPWTTAAQPPRQQSPKSPLESAMAFPTLSAPVVAPRTPMTPRAPPLSPRPHTPRPHTPLSPRPGTPGKRPAPPPPTSPRPRGGALQRRRPGPALTLPMPVAPAPGWPPPAPATPRARLVPAVGSGGNLPLATHLRTLCALAARDLPAHAPAWLREVFATGAAVTALQTKFMGIELAHGRARAPPLALSAKNRYGTVVPFESNRVRLLFRDQPAPLDDYINASWIRVSPLPPLIATQAPLPHTASDFWTMVHDHGVQVVVNLAGAGDVSRGSAHAYWPTTGAVRYGGVEVALVREVATPVARSDDGTVPVITVRTLRVAVSPTVSRTVTQIAVDGWDDGSVPSAPAVEHLLALVMPSIRESAAPIVAHCSAGCGRTGTFAALLALAARAGLTHVPDHGDAEVPHAVPAGAWAGDKDPVEQVVADLRTQRMMMVQTLPQFLFLYEMVAQWVVSGSRLAPPPTVALPGPVEEEVMVVETDAEIVAAAPTTNADDAGPATDAGASPARIAPAVPTSFDIDDRACASPAALLPAPIVQFETASASEATAVPADRRARARRPRSVARRQQQQQSGCVPLQVCVAWMLALGARAAAAARTG